MTRDLVHRTLRTGLPAAAACLLVTSAAAQTQIRPGFNLYSVSQDQEIGRQSAAEAERQLPLLEDRATTQLVDAIGRRLAAVAPGAKYDYTFKVVNASDINAFALPGGYMYVNRGLIEAARTEGELAGVMAHEMGHVALRHGTNQASKAYLGQTGLGILGGFVDKPSTERTISDVGGFGLNALFLKFSRTDEKQADIVGAQILAKAGYDPKEMVSFFQELEATEDRDPSKVERFFSSHPPLADRAARVQAEVKQLKVAVTPVVGGFAQVKSGLRKLPAAYTMDEIAQGSSGNGSLGTWGRGRTDGSVAEMDIARPSAEMIAFQQRDRFFRIQHPRNWRTYESGAGLGVTIAPDGGYSQGSRGEGVLSYGVIVNHYDPFDDGSQGMFRGGNALRDRPGSNTSFVDAGDVIASRSSLARATDDLVRQLLRINPDLRLVEDSGRTGRSEGEPAISTVLSGRSSTTGQDEKVTLVTRELPDDHVVYAVFVVPTRDYDATKDTFTAMMSSLRVDTSAHD